VQVQKIADLVVAIRNLSDDNCISGKVRIEGRFAFNSTGHFVLGYTLEHWLTLTH
jgi:hypothetical protein